MDLLFLAHRAPFPPDRGDRIRGYHALRHLAGRARVHLVAWADDAADAAAAEPLRELVASMAVVVRRKPLAVALAEALASGRPLSLAAFDGPAMRRAVAGAVARERLDAVHCYSGQMAPFVPAGVPLRVVDFCDVDSAKFASAAGTAGPVRGMLLRREARLLGAFERAVAARAAASLFVSAEEAALFARGGGERAMVVENGVDAAWFDPAAVSGPRDAPAIVFVGQMDYAPNVDAAAWFARAVLPRVRAAAPGARFAIVGRAPTRAVRALAGPDVVVSGAVADVRPWLAGAAVVVAPLRQARGVQNKVLEAMAMARPVVAGAAAAEGIDHRGALAIADGAGETARAVAALLADPERARSLGAAARAQVLRRYDWPGRLAALDAVYGFAPAAGRAAAA